MQDKEINKALGITFTENFDVGDLVKWKDLANDNENFGIIQDIYVKIKGTRPVAYARVFLINNDSFCQKEVFIIRLKLLSKHGQSSKR